MKQVFCVLLILCLAWPASILAEGTGETWALYESEFGYSLRYDASCFFLDDKYENGTAALYPKALFIQQEERDELGRRFVPKDVYHQAILMIDSFWPPLPDSWTPPPGYEPIDMELDIDWPYACTISFVDDEVLGLYQICSLFVILPESTLCAEVRCPDGDPDGWQDSLLDALNGLEITGQPAVCADFRPDFFRRGEPDPWARYMDIVADVDAEPIVLKTLRNVTEFTLEKIVREEENPSVFHTEPLYAAEGLIPGDWLKISFDFADPLSELRIVYTDFDGFSRSWDLYQSERDGSLHLTPANE